MLWLKRATPSLDNRCSIACMQQKDHLASSKLIVVLFNKHVSDILTGYPNSILGSISGGTEIDQQREEKREERYCEIQGSQEGIHRLSAVQL